MRNKIHSRDPIGKEMRRSRAQRRVGPDAKCACGESRPEALIAGSTPMICAECKRKQKGQSVMDHHHVAGRRNHDLTVAVRIHEELGTEKHPLRTEVVLLALIINMPRVFELLPSPMSQRFVDRIMPRPLKTLPVFSACQALINLHQVCHPHPHSLWGDSGNPFSHYSSLANARFAVR